MGIGEGRCLAWRGPQNVVKEYSVCSYDEREGLSRLDVEGDFRLRTNSPSAVDHPQIDQGFRQARPRR